MTTNSTRPGARDFIAFEVSLLVIASLRHLVPLIRKADSNLANQIVRSASSVSANLAEGNGRLGNDRRHFFRIAAGSAEETRAHLRVALTWGWLNSDQVREPLALLDRQLALLWKLTH